MTGRIYFTPGADRQLDQLDDWITRAASAHTARVFTCALLDHIDGIATFPRAGRARDDVRIGMRTSVFQEADRRHLRGGRTGGETVLNVLGIFHGGQDSEAAIEQVEADPDANG